MLPTLGASSLVFLAGFQSLLGLYRPSAVSAVAPLYCRQGPLGSVVSYSERDESTMVFPQPLSQSVFLGELGMDLPSMAHSTFSFDSALPTRSLLQSQGRLIAVEKEVLADLFTLRTSWCWVRVRAVIHHPPIEKTSILTVVMK